MVFFFFFARSPSRRSRVLQVQRKTRTRLSKVPRAGNPAHLSPPDGNRRPHPTQSFVHSMKIRTAQFRLDHGAGTAVQSALFQGQDAWVGTLSSWFVSCLGKMPQYGGDVNTTETLEVVALASPNNNPGSEPAMPCIRGYIVLKWCRTARLPSLPFFSFFVVSLLPGLAWLA